MALLGLAALSGCQYQTISSVDLQIHQSRLDKNGLTPLHLDKAVEVTCAPPDQWEKLPVNKTLLYTHQQWRAPDHHVGMGVALIHLPLPLSSEMVIWFAKSQYSQDPKASAKGGHLIGQWTDSIGRSWFEAENQLYHIKGYAITHGFDAWIVYSGYRVKDAPGQEEIDLAEKGADSVAPLYGDSR
jgi:hypothetical protein